MNRLTAKLVLIPTIPTTGCPAGLYHEQQPDHPAGSAWARRRRRSSRWQGAGLR